jgi:hypothetical protein
MYDNNLGAITMPAIRFTAQLLDPDSAVTTSQGNFLVTLPIDASAKLPTRGMAMVEGTANGFRFRIPLEPDGHGTHWFLLDKAMSEEISAGMGDIINLEIEPAKEWPEPPIPADLEDALAADPHARSLWVDITPMARWDWIRWLESVKLSETRAARPGKLCSMLSAGKRRPCCFNRTLRTPPRRAEAL